MGELVRLLPVVVGLVAGFLLRRFGVVGQRDGESVVKVVFFVFLPAVIFTSLSTVDLQLRLGIYPVAAVVMIAAGYFGSRLVAARAKLNPVDTAIAVSGGMVVNTTFQLPFVQVLYGAEGVARLAAFDIVNAVATFTLAHAVAIRANPANGSQPARLDRLLTSPALYAIAAGLVVNFTGVTVPAAIVDPVAQIGAATSVLIPVGVGILFDPLGEGLRKAALMVGSRMVTGMVVVTALVFALGLSGVDRTVLLLIGAAPLVFSVVAFASLENLDVRLATNAFSLSLLASVVLSVLIILIST